MSDDRLHDLGAEVPAPHATDVGWGPADWTIVFRRRRLRRVLVAAALVTVVGADPIVRTATDQPPFRASWWLYLAVVVVYCGETAWWTLTARGRTEWEEATRREIRLGHALRDHVSIGEKDRAAVSERAEELARNRKVAVVVYPLLALVAVTASIDLDSPTVPQVVLTAAAVAVCGLLVTRSLRRGRWGTRWLADPLPRDGDPPWT